MPRTRQRVVLLMMAACAALSANCGREPSPSNASPSNAAASTSAAPRVVVLISANAEWKVVRARFTAQPVERSPFGEWFTAEVPGGRAIYFHGGWGKVAAAASAQFAIDRFHPALLVNLGTCGGFHGRAAVGDVILVRRTVIYDIVERMGSADEAIRDYTTTIPVVPWPRRLENAVREGTIVSADQDLDPKSIATLAEKYQAVAADWESGAIAWVAARNRTPLVILRGVSDVVSATGDVLYGSPAGWEEAARTTMNALMDLFANAFKDLPGS